MSKKHHICVCVCTFKRPELLKHLLSKLEEQETAGLFDYSVVIADNDRFESARQAVDDYIQESKMSISYFVEPEQNIAMARNKTIENARGDFIAFIDDDEIPGDTWLLSLYKALNRYNAEGVLGGVIPEYEIDPPSWVLKGGFFDRPTHPDGFILSWENTRTGNVLLKREPFKDNFKWFDPIFVSGGEDRDFFRRKIEEGYVFRWCSDAPVFERVSSQRWQNKIILKKALLRGQMTYIARKTRPVHIHTSIFALAIYTVCLPFFFVSGHHVFMKYLIKICDHFGKVCAFLGISWIKDKYIEC